MIGMYEDDGEPVALVVNMSLEHSNRISISFGDVQNTVWNTEYNEYIAPILNPGDNSAEFSPLWLAPGDAVIIRKKKA